jgi:hypothetical protein
MTPEEKAKRDLEAYVALNEDQRKDYLRYRLEVLTKDEWDLLIDRIMRPPS